jgi:hypothetical protein
MERFEFDMSHHLAIAFVLDNDAEGLFGAIK